MSRYADGTGVPESASRADIERMLRRAGATAMAAGYDGAHHWLSFTLAGREVRVEVEMPNRFDRQFTHTPERGTQRTAAQADKAWETERRRRWRVLALLVKAKLTAIEEGVSTLEREFLADIVVPNTGGQTLWQVVADRELLGSPLRAIEGRP